MTTILQSPATAKSSFPPLRTASMILPGLASSNPKRQRKPALLASALLLLGQLLLALHQLEHLDPLPDPDADPDTDHVHLQCELCAASATHGAPLPTVALGIERTLARSILAPASLPQAPLLRPYRAQTQRAPPVPLRSTV